jgi:hypothetical protein
VINTTTTPLLLTTPDKALNKSEETPVLPEERVKAQAETLLDQLIKLSTLTEEAQWLKLVMLEKVTVDSNFIVSCLKLNIKPFQVKIYLFLVIFQSLAQTKISHMVLYGLRVISGFPRSQL